MSIDQIRRNVETSVMISDLERVQLHRLILEIESRLSGGDELSNVLLNVRYHKLSKFTHGFIERNSKELVIVPDWKMFYEWVKDNYGAIRASSLDPNMSDTRQLQEEYLEEIKNS